MRRSIAPPVIAALLQIICASPARPQTSISFGETLAGSIAVSGEVDTYTFSGNAGDRVLISMAVTTGSLDPAIELNDPQGKQICSAGFSNGGAVEINDCTLLASGTYILRAHDYGDSDTGGLYLQRLNNPGGATALSFGQTVQRTIDAAAEQDAYTFTGTANDRVLIGMAVASGGLDPAIELHDPQGKQICAAGFSNPQESSPGSAGVAVEV